MTNNNNKRSVETQLIKAAGDGDISAVRALIKAGADIHVNEGEPLRAAAWRNHTDILEVLIEAGSDLKTHGALALRWAAAGGNNEASAVLLAAMKNNSHATPNPGAPAPGGG